MKRGGGRGRWPSGLDSERESVGLDRRPDCLGRVRIPLWKTSLRNFGNSVYPALPVSFGGDTKSRRSLLYLYLVSMAMPGPGEVKDPTSPHWNVKLSGGLHHS